MHGAEVGVLRRQHDKQQEVGGGLVHLHTLLRHGGRQARRGARQAVLHVDLGQLGVGALGKADGDGARAVGLGGGLHIQQAVGTVHFPFDHGQHAVFEGLGGSAGVRGADDDGRWGHGRVLRDRQLRE
ncbi:hypothetical protein D3C80_1837300 [compost metagenome]